MFGHIFAGLKTSVILLKSQVWAHFDIRLVDFRGNRSVFLQLTRGGRLSAEMGSDIEGETKARFVVYLTVPAKTPTLTPLFQTIFAKRSVAGEG